MGQPVACFVFEGLERHTNAVNVQNFKTVVSRVNNLDQTLLQSKPEKNATGRRH